MSMRFARLPSGLILSRLGLHANAVFTALALHDRKNDGVVFPRLTTIAELADLSVNSVRKALQVLASAGWIEIHERERKGSVVSSEYRLNYNNATVSRGDMATVSSGDTDSASTVSPSDTATVSKTGVSPYHPVTRNKKKEIDKYKDTAQNFTPAPEIDASMAVSGLIQMTGLHSRDARIVLDSMAREVERKGEDLIAWADTLAKSWQLLEKSRSRLEYHWSAAKFFGEGHYKDPDGWPWKQEQGPKRKLRAVNE
jgi:Helix-turn-helix domain